jgi:hypothetical protein
MPIGLANLGSGGATSTPAGNRLRGRNPLGRYEGTGATNTADARKNLGLHKVAETGQYTDLQGRPSIVSYLSNVGEGTGGVPLIQSIIQTIVSVRTLQSAPQPGEGKLGAYCKAVAPWA